MIGMIMLAATVNPNAIGSLQEMRNAARACGTSLEVQQLPPNMRATVRASDLTFYPTVKLSRYASPKQQACVARRVPAFGLMDKWNREHRSR